jgi:TPP-dependent pyruvate/acetoin dehydrogenase alpha subunit
MERWLLAKEILTGQELETINDNIMSQVEDAVGYAISSPLPEPQDALEDVFST